MATKERYQNPVGGDTVILRLFVYNANYAADPNDIRKVDIYYLDKFEISCDNPDGRCLFTTIDGADVQRDCEGSYFVELELDPEIYVIGRYLDIWTLSLPPNYEQEIKNCFRIYTPKWYTTPIPAVYDFSFHFQPNKIRHGSRQFLQIEVNPNVPRATDLEQYYENLVISSDLHISIERACEPCDQNNSFSDLNLIVDEELTDFREKNSAFYYLDTSEMDCGLYNVWFKLEFAGNIYVSPKEQLQIYN